MSARIVPLTLREANDFVEAHHRHSARTSNDGGKFAIGLEHEGKLVGVAIVGRPVARIAASGPGTAELLRCCIGPARPRARAKAQCRCKRIWQLMGGLRLVTYTLAQRERRISRRRRIRNRVRGSWPPMVGIEARRSPSDRR
jgi:hypothetical protein